jgi:CheY-like chemotaxis protein
MDGCVNGDPAMMTRGAIANTAPRTRTLRSVAVVGGHANPDAVGAVLDAVDYDIVFIESLTHAYAQIKRESPDLVIVCLNGEDVDGCQLLSMLTLDRQTSRIPVLTYVASSCAGGNEGTDAAEQLLRRFAPCSMN